MGYFTLKSQNTTPSQLAFTRNPVLITADNAVKDQPVMGYTFTVEMDGMEIYSGRFNYPYAVNLADIVDAYAKPLPEPGAGDNDSYGPVMVIEDYNEFSLREVFVSFRGVTTKNFSFLALPGGVSKQNYRRYGRSYDAFVGRFLAQDANFFLTTRTAGWRVVMKETELYPLYFLRAQDDTALRFQEKASGRELDVLLPEGGAYALDVEALRRHFFETHGVLASNFDIYCGGEFACSVVIAAAEQSRSRHRLKFRNSLGVFEIFETTGEMSMAPEWEDKDATYTAYDHATAGYVGRRSRIERRQVARINTGTVRPEDLSFLMDLLGSDEVYLLDVVDAPVRVIPSAEEFDYAARPEAPRSFTLRLEVAEPETNILPEISDNTAARRPRVFSDEFSNQFN